MIQRSFTWTIFLVLLLMAGLLLVEWQDTLVNEVALIEVDNQSGQALDGIAASWSGGSEAWPGVADGESALVSIVVKKPGEVSLALDPVNKTVSRRVRAGQRFYVRLTAEGLSVRVSDDPSLAGQPADN